MKAKIIFLLLAYSLLTISLAQAGLNQDENKWVKNNFPAYEKDFTARIKKTDKEKHFFLYLLAGKNLYMNEVYSYAEKYLIKALETPTKESKAQIYNYLLMISYREKDQKKNKKYLKLAQAYFKSHPELVTNDITNILNFHQFWASARSKELMPLPVGTENGFTLDAKKHNFYAYFKRGEYAQAFKMLDENKVLRSETIDSMVEYDLLKILVKGKAQVDHLLCLPSFKKYSSSYDYSILLCDILDAYLKSGKVYPEKMAKLKTYFKEFDKDMNFLVAAVQKI